MYGVHTMTRYRFDLLDSAGKVSDKSFVECDDRDAAIDEAGKLLAGSTATEGVEIWNGAQMVQCLKKSGGINVCGRYSITLPPKADGKNHGDHLRQLERMPLAMVGSACPEGDDQSHSLERRSLLRWLGAASLILPTALTACANSIPPRQYKRPRSHITGKDHRNGGV